MVRFLGFKKTMEVVDRQAKNNVCASHVLFLLAITPGTAAKQVVTSHAPLTSATQKFGDFFAPLPSARARLPLCTAFKKKGPSSGSRSRERLEPLQVRGRRGTLGSVEQPGAGRALEPALIRGATGAAVNEKVGAPGSAARLL